VQQVIQQPYSSDASLYLQTFMRYDNKGNLIEQTQCSLHFAQSCGDSTVPTAHDNAQKVFRRKTYTYDSAGRYLTKVSNPHFTEQSFHSFNKLGQPQEIRHNQYDSRAGHREYTRYDSFGERYFSYTNQGGSTRISKQLCDATSMCPANAVARVYAAAPDKPDSLTFIDASGNTVREGVQLLDGRWSYTDTVYDALGRPVAVSKPYIVGESIFYDTLSYDALGRKDTVQSADDLTTRFSYYAGKTTQYISGSYSDEASSANLDRTREEQHNGRGEVSYSTDSLGNNTYFTYTSLGLPYTVTGVDNAVTTLSYDTYGRRTAMDDPDKGLIQYGFNAIGEDISRTNAGVVKTHYRNAIGQLVSTGTVQGTTSLNYSYSYGTTPFLQQQSHNGSITSYSYDSFHRPSGESYQIDSKSWSRSYSYNEYGRLFRDMDIAGNGHGQQYQYANGYLNRIFEVKTGQAYHRMDKTDAYQNLTHARTGGTIRVERDYDAKSGRLTGLFAGYGLIQNQYYRYDQLGNLRYRSNLNGFGSTDLVESFSYDALNRLQQVTFNGVVTQSMSYSDNGNILTKSDLESGATYQYGSKATSCSVTPGVHAASQIGTRRFCYDARGNQTHRYVSSSLTRRVDYTAFDKPHTIWSNQGESRFNYDATEKLVKRVDKKAGGDMVTYYVGGHEAIFQADGSSEIKRYIRDIAIHSIKSTGASALHYVFNDHLGSGSVITDASGNVVETASFDAFGKRRNATSWQGYTNPFTQLSNLQVLLSITQKGYTGHIQVDHAAVIHTGGRIYDPELGRFMQADPIVQDPRDAQSLNRYSYVFNNPLSYTDPTGYDCHNAESKACNSAIEQAKKDAAKAAAQTQGATNQGEVDSGNSSADLQNSAQRANGNLNAAIENGSASAYLNNLASDGSWLAWGGGATGLALEVTEGLNMVSGRGAFLGIQTMGSTLSDFSLIRGPSASSNGINRVLMSLDYSAFGKVLSEYGGYGGIFLSVTANAIAHNNGIISFNEFVGKSLLDYGMYQVGTKGGKYGAVAALSYTLIDLTYGPQNVPGVIALKRDFAQSGRNVAEHLKQNRIENRRAFSEAATLYRETRVDFMHRVFGIPNMNLD
jgi:RHS repeat-associated protein